MVKIRLSRRGKKHAPFYRVVVADARSPRDGRFIEKLGWYDPRRKELKLDLSRIREWISKGAKPTPAVEKLIERQGGKK
jgi:small subunit ribosomal protein S16